ncbi:unnamed protein product [Anisakis simplex]|uniref:ShKT domain-containing protein n=1 Tax=Anisakis simplex TaxID=6269 RepID=A0A0M3KBC7_ANISI|nr:unnamed protein product [Anisakis simplex]
MLIKLIDATPQPYLECSSECDHLEENSAYESCLKSCIANPRSLHTANGFHRSFNDYDDSSTTSRSYPPPPTNITVETVAVIGDVKFLELTVYWDAEPGNGY